jgi:DNA repair photolyase
MAKSQYEGYSSQTPTILVREEFGGAKIYASKAQSLLNKATGFIGSYDFTLNPYRGCQYGCSYCYATAFSPNPQMRQDWGNWVIVKQNAAELLAKELAAWDKKHPGIPARIYMSSVTDPYQPIEFKEGLTRTLLQVMLPYQPTLVIQTRSPIIVRDMEILQNFHRLRVNMSIPTGSESVRKDFEPRSPSIAARIRAIGKLKHNIAFNGEHEAKFSITITPLLPTFPADQIKFISKLAVVDRIVIQDFHPTGKGLLTASTRPEAEALKNKYLWWYDNESEKYQQFKADLISQLPEIEIMEGKAGFGYD